MSISIPFRTATLAIATMVSIVCLAPTVHAEQTLLRNICRVKGQEENTLRGMGLVVGLQGTGDSEDSLPTMRALARAMELMNFPVTGPETSDRDLLAAFKGTKNVALVWVTATVPATGGRRGDQLDCTVSAIRAKSLRGGELVFAALHGPNVKDPTVYGLANGRLELDDDQHLTHAKIHNGCRLEEDVYTSFQDDGYFTLVIDKNHAGFTVANEIALWLGTQFGYRGSGETEEKEVAVAIDATNIVVRIPGPYRDAPVAFIAEVMETKIPKLQNEARVVINERAGSIVIGGDVDIGPAVVTHKNVTVDTQGAGRSLLSPIMQGDIESDNAKLKDLVAALERVQVPPQDQIEIIKGLYRNGKLHARLIIE
ncbi:MAG: flagellar basal body P-ring protein FlgI [Planctomycetales bacterium]|nr:flagellar basal body P-ring protein FlgI [Planctomycetales bacterium]